MIKYYSADDIAVSNAGFNFKDRLLSTVFHIVSCICCSANGTEFNSIPMYFYCFMHSLGKLSIQMCMLLFFQTVTPSIRKRNNLILKHVTAELWNKHLLFLDKMRMHLLRESFKFRFYILFGHELSLWVIALWWVSLDNQNRL